MRAPPVVLMLARNMEASSMTLLRCRTPVLRSCSTAKRLLFDGAEQFSVPLRKLFPTVAEFVSARGGKLFRSGTDYCFRPDGGLVNCGKWCNKLSTCEILIGMILKGGSIFPNRKAACSVCEHAALLSFSVSSCVQCRRSCGQCGDVSECKYNKVRAKGVLLS